MAKPEVSVSIRADAQLAEARRDLLRDFALMRSDAAGAAEDIERPFDRAARGVGDSFESARLQTRRDLEGISDDATRTAADVSAPFDRSAVEVGSAYDRARSEIRRELSGIEDDATAAARGIEGPFARSANELEGLFSRSRSAIKRDFDRIEGDAASGASGIEAPFRRAFSGVEDAASKAAASAGERLEGLASDVDLSNVGGTIADQLQGILGKAGPVAGVLAGAAALLGGEIASGISSGFSRRQGSVGTAIRTGLDAVDVARAGEAAGEAFAGGFGEGLAELRFEAAALQKEFQGLTLGASEAEIVKQADLLRDKFGVDLPQSVEIARRSIANGMAPDVTTALGNILLTAQELPLTFEEALDVQKEYAATFGPLNRSGAQMALWLGEVSRSGAFENVDKGADAIRELNTSLNETERVRPFIAELGLDIAKLQDAINDGRGDDAFNAVFDALIALEDPTRRNVISAELFKSALEDVGDKAAAFEALRFDETLLDGAAAMDEATRAAEENRSGLDELRSDVTAFADSAAEKYGRYYQTVSDGTEGFIRDLTGMRDETDTVGKSIAELGKSGEVTSEILSRGSRSLEDFSLEADGAAGSTSGLTGSVEELRNELSGLFDFSADQLMRDIKEETERLTEAFAEADGAAVGLNGAIDIQTKGGAELQAQLEQLARAQRDSIELYLDGKVTGEEFASTQALIEANLRAAGAEAGLSAAQVQGLIDKYLAVPSSVTTDVRTTGVGTATEAMNQFERAIGRIPRSKTVRVNVVGPNLRAEGGLTIGPTIVGEEGPELARTNRGLRLVGVGGPELHDFQSTTMIYSNPETRRRLGGKIPRLAGGGTAFEETLAIIGDNPGARTDPELVSPESRIRAVIREEMRKAARPGPLVGVMNVGPGRDAAQELRNIEVVARTAGV